MDALMTPLFRFATSKNKIILGENRVIGIKQYSHAFKYIVFKYARTFSMDK